ncbi:protein FAM83A [Ornithorhynchus anatinus]|uniref:protein FAM83A n=1 Tax=Ornithorhynchus anatinus TaxID=9258 RepID=UPI0007AA74AE|nr:protein FAM83A [Ornithorhynchus anatinus]
MSWRRRVGKIQKRLEDVKTRWTRPTRMDFSHNESIRLATDALVNGGLESYQETLGEEGEVDFLSSAEACYIQENTSQPNGAPQSPGGEWLDLQESDVDSLQSGTYFPQFSGGGEPDLGDAGKPYLKEKSSVTVYFQTDRHSSIRDLIRRCIGKTNQVLAILMDEFTDIEIFCDVLEAANKRGVFVYILLDQRGVKLFNEMCNRAQILEIHLKNICIRSVAGEVYCAKSGRKFSGRIQEKFIISDWRCVLSGSYR